METGGALLEEGILKHSMGGVMGIVKSYSVANLYLTCNERLLK